MTAKAQGLWEAFLAADDRYKEVQRRFLEALWAGDIVTADGLRPLGASRQIAVQETYLVLVAWTEAHPEAFSEAARHAVVAEANRRVEESVTNSNLIYLALPPGVTPGQHFHRAAMN